MQEIAWEAISVARLPDVTVIAKVVQARVENRIFAVACIVAGEKFPEGKLERLRLHWGCSISRGQTWQAPPTDWQTFPPDSRPAGIISNHCLILYKQNICIQ